MNADEYQILPNGQWRRVLKQSCEPSTTKGPFSETFGNVQFVEVGKLEGVVRPCPLHKETLRGLAQRAVSKSVIQGPPEGWPDFLFEDCPRCVSELDPLESTLRRQKQARVPAAYWCATLGELQLADDEREVLEKYARAPRGFLVIRGGVGLGKTHAACALCGCVEEAVYFTTRDLVVEHRKTYRDRSAEDVRGTVEKAGLVVLDEFGRHPPGQDATDLLFDVLDGRYAEGRPCVIVTNATIEGLREGFGDALTDRINGDLAAVVSLAGTSFRGTSQDTREQRRRLAKLVEARSRLKNR